MADSNRKIVTEYAYKITGTAAIKQAQQLVTSYIATLNEIPPAVRRVAAEQARTILARGDGDEAIAQAKRFIATLDEQVAAYRELEAQAKRTSETQVRGVGTSSGGLRSVDRAFTLTQQVASGLGNTEVSQVANVIGDVVSGLSTLGVVGGAVGLAIGVVSLAMRGQEEQAKHTAEAIEAEIDRRTELSRLIAQGATSEDLQERARLQQSDVTAQRSALEELRSIQTQRDQLLENVQPFSISESEFNRLLEPIQQRFRDLIGDPNASVLGNLSGSPLDEAIQKAITDLEVYQRALDSTNDALEDGATLANDLAEAQERINELFGQAAILTAQSTADRIRYENEFSRLTTEQAGERRRQLEVERQALLAQVRSLEQFGGESEDVSRALEQASQRLGDVNAQLETLSNTSPAQLRNSFLEVLEVAGQAAQRIGEIEARRQQDIDAARASRVEKIADLERNAEEQRTEVITKAGDDRLKAQKDFEERFKRIFRDFRRAEQKAIEERDAVALDAARTRFADERSDAEDQYRKQLDTVDENLRKQNDTLKRRYDQQYAQIVKSTNDQINAINQRANAEVQAQRQGVINAVNATQQRLQIEQQGYQLLLQLAGDYVNKLSALGAKYNPSVTTIPGTGKKVASSGGGNVYSYPTGGYPPINTPVRVHAGEVARDMQSSQYVQFSRPTRIYDANTSAQMRGDTNNFMFNINGAGIKTIRAETRRQVVAEIDSLLEEAGIA